MPAASDVRRSSLTLSWYGPTYDGGSAVCSYHLEIWDSVEPQWKPLVSCNSTSYNVQVSRSQPDVILGQLDQVLVSLVQPGLLLFLVHQDSEESCVSLQNLLPERQYKFRVRAENIYGIGEPSAESAPVTMGLVDDGEWSASG